MEGREREDERERRKWKDKTFMSFIALLDGNEMKWKIEREKERKRDKEESGGRPRDKRGVIPSRKERKEKRKKNLTANKNDFLAVKIGGTIDRRSCP